MSQFEGRRELGDAAHQAIDRAAVDLDELAAWVGNLSDDAESAASQIAEFMDVRGFDIEWGIGGVQGAFRAEARHWDDEEMRKGLRHGHVAFVTHLGRRSQGAEPDGSHPASGVAIGAAIGLAATQFEMHGTVSLIYAPREDDLRLLAERGQFEAPDCALTAYPSTDGGGFQHTINPTGESLGDDTFAAMLPSRILARRIKTFGDTLKMRQDRVTKQPPGSPTAWGAVSQVTPTAIARFPVEPGDDDDARAQMRLMAQVLASTGLDVLGDMEFRGFAEGEFIRGLRQRGIERVPRRWLGVHPVLPPKEQRASSASLPEVIVRGPGVPEPPREGVDGEDER